MLNVQDGVGLVKVRANIPDVSVRSIKSSQPLVENVRVLPFALKREFAFIVVDAGSVNSVSSALTIAWLTVVGLGRVVGSGSIVYMILVFIVSWSLDSALICSVQAEVGLVKVRANIPGKDSVRSIKPSQPLVENVRVLPFALKREFAFSVIESGSVNSVSSASTAAWLTVGGVEGIDGSGRTVNVIIALTGSWSLDSALICNVQVGAVGLTKVK